MNNYQHQTPPPVTRHHHHHLPPPPPLPHHHPSLLPQPQPPLPMLPAQQQQHLHQQAHQSPPQHQPLISNSLAIRQEIQRFESVHPSIYAIYDLIDLLPIGDAQIAQQIRDHVVCIEGS
ncbi:centaurin-gamma-1A-like [Anastrepha ludens]|uniref:centaurin-gamma-1A-like n=1 Tax=Anastrepha ludens TaxID=28586 RepID=UPI0023B12C4E|nr:centaurin-gamma-1A-like [Anastrepha ludens]XP_053959217.1 centaurin-gamma-1A-like [Anastrepha ludens]XP_053959218.1 centaurin-gamma-1A-like [Anastrepha ludens]XP_053959219.1 centaurin-gamma-1A-like [Anastrepha ludens]